MASAEPRNLNFSSIPATPQQTFKQVQQHQEVKTKYIPELLLKLYNIYGDNNLSHQRRTFENLISCQRQQNFNFYNCERCFSPHFHRIPCTSFFCDTCRKILANRLKQKLLTYIWNTNHRFCVFTLPPEIQEICKGWTSYLFINNKFTLATNLVYKSVSDTIKEYFAKRNKEVGFIIYPHTEHTFNLDWFFHLNILISTRGLRKSSKFTNFDKKTNKRILPNYQAKYQTLETFFIDYDAIKEIYLKHLSRNFKVKIKRNAGNPIHFGEELKPKAISNNLFGYVRKLLLKSKHIKNIDNSTITLKRWNTKNKRYESFNLSHKQFYNRCVQHIPPKFMRTIRLYGLYSQANKKRYFLTPVIEYIEKQIKCSECGSNLRLMYSVSRGQIVKIDEYYLCNNFKKILLMLDMKDFDIGDFFNLYTLKEGFYILKAKKDEARIGIECPLEFYPVKFSNEDDFGIEKYKKLHNFN